MRRLLAATLLPLSIAACQPSEAPAPTPTRPPGEVYQAPGGAFLFVRPPVWRGQVLAHPGTPPDGAASSVEWRVRNADESQEKPVFWFHIYDPAAWQAARAAATGTVVHEDSAHVVVAVLPEANPYPSGSLAASRFDSVSIPLDTIRARLIVR